MSSASSTLDALRREVHGKVTGDNSGHIGEPHGNAGQPDYFKEKDYVFHPFVSKTPFSDPRTNKRAEMNTDKLREAQENFWYDRFRDRLNTDRVQDMVEDYNNAMLTTIEYDAIVKSRKKYNEAKKSLDENFKQTIL